MSRFSGEGNEFSSEMKAGGLKAISRSVTEGNHRKQAEKYIER